MILPEECGAGGLCHVRVKVVPVLDGARAALLTWMLIVEESRKRRLQEEHLCETSVFWETTWLR